MEDSSKELFECIITEKNYCPYHNINLGVCHACKIPDQDRKNFSKLRKED